jgi:glycerophosphoryl diester phosphodiesterase
MTAAPPPAFLDHLPPLAIAHRGGSLEVEENTLPAFAHAEALGYTHVELDVHATRDGEVVVHHDPTFARMTGDRRAVRALDWTQVAQLRTHGGAEIPRLADVLAAFPRLCVTIEVKTDTVIDPLAEVIRRTGALDRVCIGSFSAAPARRLRARLGEGLIWSPAHAGVARLWLRGWGVPLPPGDFALVQVPPTYRGVPIVTPRFVRAAHDAGIRVQVWTVNEVAR